MVRFVIVASISPHGIRAGCSFLALFLSSPSSKHAIIPPDYPRTGSFIPGNDLMTIHLPLSPWSSFHPHASGVIFFFPSCFLFNNSYSDQTLQVHPQSIKCQCIIPYLPHIFIPGCEFSGVSPQFPGVLHPCTCSSCSLPGVFFFTSYLFTFCFRDIYL